MKQGFVAGIVILLMLVGIGSIDLSALAYSVDYVSPELYEVNSSHSPVNFGVQPETSPLVLSVRVGIGGSIDRATIDLEQLSGARYYDPGSDTISHVGGYTPLWKVYEINGEEAYLFETASEYKNYKYRTAITHTIIKGTAVPTNKWQVELPNAGYRFGNFDLSISVVNEFSHGSNARIDLQVVYDWDGPMVLSKINYPIAGPITCPGDTVTIEAGVIDDLSGTFSVRLMDSPEHIFGENPNLVMIRQANTNLWEVKNTIPENIAPGTYSIRVMAVDRAGNKTVSTSEIKVAKERSSFEIKLDKGWNLISVPKALENPAVEAVFGGTPIVSVQTVIEGQRLNPTKIEPGWGYLVESIEETTVSMNFAQHNPSEIPIILNMKPGWNLIGYASKNLEPAIPLTLYLGADLKDEWVIVYTRNGAQARWKSNAPYVWATDSFPTITDRPYSESKDNLPVMELGKGYWIYLTDEGMLIP